MPRTGSCDFLGTLGGKEQKQLSGWGQQPGGSVLPESWMTPRREHAELKARSPGSAAGKGFPAPRYCTRARISATTPTLLSEPLEAREPPMSRVISPGRKINGYSQL